MGLGHFFLELSLTLLMTGGKGVGYRIQKVHASRYKKQEVTVLIKMCYWCEPNLIGCLVNVYRLILIYLISARMVLGTFPRPELLAKYNLMDKYHTLCSAIKQGNLSGYQYHLERHMPTLLREGNYIMLKERVKVVIWRCLFRRVWVSWSQVVLWG